MCWHEQQMRLHAQNREIALGYLTLTCNAIRFDSIQSKKQPKLHKKINKRHNIVQKMQDFFLCILNPPAISLALIHFLVTPFLIQILFLLLQHFLCFVMTCFFFFILMHIQIFFAFRHKSYELERVFFFLTLSLPFLLCICRLFALFTFYQMCILFFCDCVFLLLLLFCLAVF